MEVKDVLTNEFQLRYDEEKKRLLIYRVKNGELLERPVELRLSTLLDMGRDDASKWLGETILLLIPEMRTQLFKLKDET